MQASCSSSQRRACPARPTTVLQEWAWTVSEAADKLAGRSVSTAAQHDPALACEPMFVMELAVKCFVWARLPYKYVDPDTGADRPLQCDSAAARPGGAQAQRSAALANFQRFAEALLGLEGTEAYTDTATASKVLVAHGHNRVVVAARGSKTALNAKHDAKVRLSVEQVSSSYHVAHS